MRTAQELFETVVLHQRKQGKKSIGAGGTLEGGCRYRGLGGNKCAVGCLIQDEDYHHTMEGGSVEDLINFHYLPTGIHNELYQNFNLVTSLQLVHDTNEVYEWETKWQDIAVRFQLRYPQP